MMSFASQAPEKNDMKELKIFEVNKVCGAYDMYYARVPQAGYAVGIEIGVCPNCSYSVSIYCGSPKKDKLPISFTAMGYKQRVACDVNEPVNVKHGDKGWPYIKYYRVDRNNVWQ